MHFEASGLPETEAAAFAATLNALLEGMSVQARDGASRAELEQIARIAIRVLPPSVQSLEIFTPSLGLK